MSRQTLRTLVVEDDHDFRYLISKTLREQPDIELLGSSELDDIDAAREIRLTTDAKVLILTAFDDPDTVIKACVQGFASGYLFKSQFASLVQTLRETAKGSMPQGYLIRSAILSALSPAEQTVFELMLGKDIRLQSSPKTIANQKTGVLQKLGLRNQQELVHLFRST